MGGERWKEERNNREKSGVTLHTATMEWSIVGDFFFFQRNVEKKRLHSTDSFMLTVGGVSKHKPATVKQMLAGVSVEAVC